MKFLAYSVEFESLPPCWLRVRGTAMSSFMRSTSWCGILRLLWNSSSCPLYSMRTSMICSLMYLAVEICSWLMQMLVEDSNVKMMFSVLGVLSQEAGSSEIEMSWLKKSPVLIVISFTFFFLDLFIISNLGRNSGAEFTKTSWNGGWEQGQVVSRTWNVVKIPQDSWTFLVSNYPPPQKMIPQ